jgi:hypothetical protein
MRGRWCIGWAPLAALALYLLLVATAHWTAGRAEAVIPVCRFKLVTGIPCPTCGATRAAFSLLAGHLVEAWRFNPLMTCAYLAAPPWLGMAFFARRRVVVEFSRPARWVAVGALAVAAAGNWFYLIARGV